MMAEFTMRVRSRVNFDVLKDGAWVASFANEDDAQSFVDQQVQGPAVHKAVEEIVSELKTIEDELGSGN
jgi:hypothetical protein